MLLNKTTISYSLYFLGLLFVLYILGDAWQELSLLLINVNPLFLGLSTLAMLVHTLAGCWLLKRIFMAVEVSITYRSTCRIFYLSQMSKYLPGVIWGFAMQASLLVSESPMRKVIAANVRLTLLILSTFFFISIFLILLEFSLPASLLSLLFAFLSVHVISNFSLGRLLPRGLRNRAVSLLRYQYEGLRISSPLVFITCLLLFATYLISIACIILSVYDVDLLTALTAGIYQCLAWIAGTLVFIVPAGMGVREAAFIALGNLGSTLTPEQVQAIAVTARFIQLLQDLLFSMGALLLTKLKVL